MALAQSVAAGGLGGAGFGGSMPLPSGPSAPSFSMQPLMPDVNRSTVGLRRRKMSILVSGVDDAVLARVVALTKDVVGELSGKFTVEVIPHENTDAFAAWLADSEDWFGAMGESALEHDAGRPFVAVVTGTVDRHVPTNAGCDRGENAVTLRLKLQATVKVRLYPFPVSPPSVSSFVIYVVSDVFVISHVSVVLRLCATFPRLRVARSPVRPFTPPPTHAPMFRRTHLQAVVAELSKPKREKRGIASAGGGDACCSTPHGDKWAQPPSRSGAAEIKDPNANSKSQVIGAILFVAALMLFGFASIQVRGRRRMDGLLLSRFQGWLSCVACSMCVCVCRRQRG